ncbi:hypothetical protein AJ80_04574 [Polytolypa hystricis UAMH7299]|uniref:NTF2 domain-containing protein n=1 Tax=Polytolypa hystricis (strain UAMH7299) TaxID=1447883 RepID=A0A2B7YC71_POLH7|nr:hypothetical protein AJ80_04574 [Polytolypa hystricis UAMH7299]
MTHATQDTLTKVSTEAATEFVLSYYPALRSSRETIASYYASVTSTILFNGNVVADGPSVQKIFMEQMPPARYEVQSYDCQIINLNYPIPPSAKPQSSVSQVKNMSILVMVSGYVRFGDEKETPDTANRGFSETFVLVPTAPGEAPAGPRGRGKKHWLIQSQNFRLVV